MPHLECPRCDLQLYKSNVATARIHCARCLSRDGLRVALVPAQRQVRFVDRRSSRLPSFPRRLNGGDPPLPAA
jgi:hypothetical protein